MPSNPAETPPRALIVAAALLPVAAIGAIIALAASQQSPAPPVVIATVPAPQAGAAECQSLLSAVPEQLGDYQRAETADPTPAGAAAWRPTERPSNEPVIMRCGLDRPAEFVVGAPIQMVDDVQWFRLQDADARRSTWLCVDRPVYVALTLPDGSGPTPIQQLSAVIDKNMPAVPIRPAPAR